MSIVSRIRTPLYRNTGSVARDHLASERTFLAWMRTGLGFIALGIAIERFSQLDLSELLQQTPQRWTQQMQQQQQQQKTTETKSTSLHSSPTTNTATHRSSSSYKEQSDMLVGALLGSGTGSIAYGTSRYFVNLRLLERGLFKPAYHGPAVLSIFVAGMAGGVYWNTLKDRSKRGGDDEDGSGNGG